MKKTCKQILSLALAVMLVLSLVPTVSAAEEIASGPCGENLTWSLTGDGVLTLSGDGDMEYFEWEERPWIDYLDQIQSVIVESGVTSLSQWAFEACENLTSVSLPEGLKKLDRDVFAATGLTSIYLPASLEEFDAWSMYYAEYMEDVQIDPENPWFTVADGIVYSKDMTQVIYYPWGLEGGEVVLPETVTAICQLAFVDCTHVTSVILPEGLTYIGLYGLSNIGATEITLPSTLVSIEDLAFCETPLSSITIPASVEYIGYAAFAECSELTEITFLGDAPDIIEDAFAAVTAQVNYPEDNDTWNEDMMQNYGGDLTWGEPVELIQLASPTEPIWGKRWDWASWDEDNQVSVFEWVDYPGYISWTPNDPDQGQATILVYQEGEEEPYGEYSWYFGEYKDEHRSVDGFINADPESGTYYFKVISTGDGTEYADSEAAVSDTWTYVKPDAELPACTDLSWVKKPANNPNDTYMPDYPYERVTATFTAPMDSEYYGGLGVRWYYSETEGGELQSMGSSWGHYVGEDLEFWLDDMNFQQNGAGYYYFQVRALSSDITKVCNGPWSELSPAYNLAEIIDNVSGELNDIIQSEAPVEEKVNAIQAMDSEDLKNSMLADLGVVDQLAQLENEYMGPAEISVSQEAAAFEPEKISVVGANLNLEAGAEESATLVVDKPQKEHVLDASYNNSVAVKFSMTLENVVNTEALDVPVQITLPVPAAINPDFLVVLHYHADGNYDEIIPYVFEDDQGQYYAQFVLTSFSDFVMTEEAKEEEKPTFTDVDPDKWYAEPVDWAVSNGITSGTGTNTFGPNDSCTRAQVVMFLWAANGRPAPESTTNPFSDIKAGKYYYDAVLWAVEQGITGGAGNGTFAPDRVVTRAEFVTMLWNALEKPSVSISNPFPDVVAGKWYATPVLWAYANGITSGMKDGTFGVNEPCTRAQVVTFLYSAYGK